MKIVTAGAGGPPATHRVALVRKALCVGLVAGVFVSSLSGCESTAKVVDGEGGATIVEAQQERYDGPKARIAVGRIIDKSGDGKQSLSYQLGLLAQASKNGVTRMTVDSVTGGIRDMLTTALFNSNRYIVLEREALDAVLVEQEFSHKGRVGAATRIPMGQVEGAELLVVGAITGFDAGRGGGSIPIPIPLNDDGDFAVLHLSFKKSFISMDLRVIDTATARLLASVAVEGSVRKGGAALSGYLHSNYGHVELPVLLSGFTNTPVEKAMQQMVNAAVSVIVDKTPAVFQHRQGEPGD